MRGQGGKSQGGKRNKKKTDSNFIEPYSGASELPPPPIGRDVTAVPAKLRRIMQLKSAVAVGAPRGSQATTSVENGRDRKTLGVERKLTAASSRKRSLVGDTNDANHEDDSRGDNEGNAGIEEPSAGKPKRSFSSKWKKNEDELKMLVERMDEREKTGIRRSVGSKRKSFLKERKKKKKGNGTNLPGSALPSLDQHEKVAFGETVQAPPKLSFPKKAVEVKAKEMLSRGQQVVLHEKLRMQAIEAYRQRKNWSSRPGGAPLPVLNLTDAEIPE